MQLRKHFWPPYSSKGYEDLALFWLPIFWAFVAAMEHGAANLTDMCSDVTL